MSTKQDSYPLLRDAYAIIDGIPADRFYLNSWRLTGKSAQDCGTIACAAGWLAMHPTMRDCGLRNDREGAPIFKNSLGISQFDYQALAKFFCMTVAQAQDIFCPRWRRSAYNPVKAIEKYSDKELWKFRVRKFLEVTKV